MNDEIYEALKRFVKVAYYDVIMNQTKTPNQGFVELLNDHTISIVENWLYMVAKKELKGE